MVIDGQQRLTTLLIMFAAGASLIGYSDAARTLKDTLKGFMIQKKDFVNFKEARPRLRTCLKHQQFFWDNIINDFKTPEIKKKFKDGEMKLDETCTRFMCNANELRVLLRKMQKHKKDEERLVNFLSHVASNCHLVAMVCKSESKAYKIFSTLNGRGMELNVIDKLKADLMRSVADENNSLDKKWSRYESRLGRVRLAKIFGWLLKYKTVHRQVRANQKVQIKMEDVSQDDSLFDKFTRPNPEEQKQILRKFFDIAEELGAFRSCNFGDPELDRHCLYLKSFPNKEPWMCLLLHFFKKERRNEYRLQLVKGIERLAIVLALDAGRDLREVSRWSAVAEVIVNYKPNEGNPETKLKKIFNLNKQERDVFQTYLIDTTLVQSELDINVLLVKHILARIDGSFDFSKYRVGDLQIEEIFPRTVKKGSEWSKQKMDGKAYWYPTKRRTAAGKLGNMVLLLRDTNIESQDELKEKLLAFEESNCFKWTKEACEYKRFSHSDFAERHEKLTKEACKIFDVPWRLSKSAKKAEADKIKNSKTKTASAKHSCKQTVVDLTKKRKADDPDDPDTTSSKKKSKPDV